jgi:hypothetical protein
VDNSVQGEKILPYAALSRGKPSLSASLSASLSTWYGSPPFDTKKMGQVLLFPGVFIIS